MPVNRTPEFRTLVQEKGVMSLETKRRRVPKSKSDAATSDGKVVFDKEYLKEGYNVLNHIQSLTRMLSHIRKPYLNLDSSRQQFLRQSNLRTLDFNGAEDSWSNIRHLTNEERDQIDLQARVILTRCSERVKEMEALEKRRAEIATSKANPIGRFLPARLRQEISSSAASDFIAAHHASITWYLSRRLAETSQAQKEMQEERVKRQMERTQSLGAGVAREAAKHPSIPAVDLKPKPSAGSWLESASSNLASSWVATLGGPSLRPEATSTVPTTVPIEELDDGDDELELTESQIMQFEDENAAILRNVQDTLASVQLAESRLMEISSLQTELIAHLSHQTELTDQLYDDAIASTVTMEKGNEQLEEAKRRGKDSRFLILMFLIAASLSLLFLHYY